jgi:hypothetical protein
LKYKNEKKIMQKFWNITKNWKTISTFNQSLINCAGIVYTIIEKEI